MSPDSDTTVKTLPTKIEELVMEITEALSGAKVFSTSVHDATGEAVWTSEGIVGPDDHALVLDALDTFALEQLRKSFEKDLGDGRIKVVFAAREPRGALRGALLIEATERSLGGRDGERGSMQRGFGRLLQRLALRLAGKSSAGEPPAEEYPHLPVLLFVQQLLKLRSSGRTRRYEVLLRSDAPGKVTQKAPADLLAAAELPGSGGKLDRYVVDELCRWLTENHAQLEVDPASFTVNLSTGALLNEAFIGFLEKTIEAAHLSPRVLGFEIREQQCLKHPKETERFLAACDRLGCQVVIDDFTFHSDVLPMLRQRAVRMLKIDAALTTAAMKDKVAQAQVVAISQGSRVLGMHCVAKRIDSPMARQWLSAVGVDFAQGFLLEGPLPITQLASLRLTEPVRRV
jgi:EAL domain-containing protein (putative c-di-GMP-specific phosphodiesterase class I)